MSKNRFRNRDLQALMQALCDERLTDDETARLEAILTNSAAAQQCFVDVISLDTSLQYWAGVEGHLQSRALDDGCDIVPAGVNTKSRYKSVWSLGIVATIAGCVLLGWLFERFSRGVDAPEGAQIAADVRHEESVGKMAIAGRVIKFTPETEWRATNLAIMRGTYVRPGQMLQLERGVAEIQFVSGATAILEGPAKFEVKSPTEGCLYAGKVAIVGNENSGSIVLSTPSTQLRMTSGEIGATVDENGVTEVQVMSGRLSANLLTKDGLFVRQCSLEQGSGTRFDASTSLVSKVGFTRLGYVFSVHDSFVAYQNYLGSAGNQVFEGSLGMDFVVKDTIRVTKLGVFDSGADGLKRTLRAELWLRDEAGSAYRFDDDFGIERIAELTFTSADPGMLVESNRFKQLPTPIILHPGAYTIVASGYGKDEPNGNEGNPVYDRNSDKVIVVPAWESGWRDDGLPIHSLKGLDDGGASILFVGSARWDEVVGQFPRVVDSGVVNRFQAGTFEFQRVEKHADQGGGLLNRVPDRSAPLREKDSRDSI